MTSVDSVRAQLDSLLRVTLTDGRVLVGRFSCFDKQRNVLLNETQEQRFAENADAPPSTPQAPEFERHLGLVLVPRRHVAAVHAMSS
jgi:small nuclear ribonucleoprotein (snRNP)-like protein